MVKLFVHICMFRERHMTSSVGALSLFREWVPCMHTIRKFVETGLSGPIERNGRADAFQTYKREHCVSLTTAEQFFVTVVEVFCGSCYKLRSRSLSDRLQDFEEVRYGFCQIAAVALAFGN